jgi:acetyl esterase/lipase
LPDEEDAGERERRVADGVHDESFLRGCDCLGPLVPEADQEVAGESHEPPTHKQEEEVPRLDEQEHREDEERHVGEVATLLVVATDDKGSAPGTLKLFQGLRDAGVSAELHVYASGGHGYGMRDTGHPVNSWPQRCLAWMTKQGYLK